MFHPSLRVWWQDGVSITDTADLDMSLSVAPHEFIFVRVPVKADQSSKKLSGTQLGRSPSRHHTFKVVRVSIALHSCANLSLEQSACRPTVATVV